MKTKFIGIVALGKNRQIVPYPEEGQKFVDSVQNSDDTTYVLANYEKFLPLMAELYCYVVDDEREGELFPEYMFYEWEMADTEVHSNWSLYHMKKTPDFEG